MTSLSKRQSRKTSCYFCMNRTLTGRHHLRKRYSTTSSLQTCMDRHLLHWITVVEIWRNFPIMNLLHTHQHSLLRGLSTPAPSHICWHALWKLVQPMAWLEMRSYWHQILISSLLLMVEHWFTLPGTTAQGKSFDEYFSWKFSTQGSSMIWKGQQE